MYGFIQLIVYSFFVLAIIFIGHMFFEYTKNKYTPKVTMDIYQTQVEKYINIVDDLKKNYEENK